ncbi:MAG: DEAD/DEAH box helicase [Elusimicrobiaceae bacterium]|nr:DEAD/DEAH box helicase [Elusimicrobiaceae bacterium]
MKQLSGSISFFQGLPNEGAEGYFAAKNYLNKKKNIVYLTAAIPEDFANAVHEFAPKNTLVLTFPEMPSGQAAALYELLHSKHPYALATSYLAWQTPLPGPAEFSTRTLTLKQGDTCRRGELLDLLQSLGYTREDYTELPGHYAVRGSVVDVFSPSNATPVRLYFSGNKISTISTFDIDTQSTTAYLDKLVILPLTWENLPATLADYLPQAQVILSNPASDIDLNLYPGAAVFSATPLRGATDCNFKSNIAFQANFKLLDQEVASLQAQGLCPVITCLNRGELDRLSELMQEYEHLKKLPLQISLLSHGFYQLQDKMSYITSGEILNRKYYASSLLKNFHIENAQKVRFKDLRPGDYIVHQHYGIGKYLGLKILEDDKNPTDCLLIEFRRNSKLYVPMQDFKLVQKYISAGGKAPSLSTLGGVTWKEVKKRVKEEAQKTAKEILKLEALRQATGGQALPGDPNLEQEFADSFPFVLTAGQIQAIEDVLNDLSQDRSMDRVLVGDVGFGKTEVAMRAALHAVTSGKQVMMLVPTTILADQHYKTFTKRMAGFPVNIQMLCRFQTKKEQKEIVRQVKDGVCDIIIGTHRLLSKDIAFKDLGLVIIDEEHRFGVRQKEKIKAKSAGVHTLMLSATPIPRTLNQSLSALRDISMIDTPPRGRTPIKTVVTPWNNELAQAAILQELARGGQIYYVYNSVQSMESRYLFLKKLVPEARICMAHGQMKESELEQTLWDFNQGKYDILLASTIIESGIDITNANTLVVENAQNFGLAQLYQLRGRIGRGDKKAYCYLFHPDWLFKKPEDHNPYAEELASLHVSLSKEKDPTEEAKKRLSALMEFSELGSGFKLALRDMEIRGAGELLGVKQHGYANEVGLSLYCDLVAAEVKKLKGEPVRRDIRATISLPLAAYIPPDYLPDDSERLKYYKELMSADETRAKQLLAKLQDFAGPIPPELTNLNRILQLARRAGQLKMYRVQYIAPAVEVFFTHDFHMPPDFPAQLFKQYSTRAQFIKSRHGDGIRITLPPQADPTRQAEQIISFFEHILVS